MANPFEIKEPTCISFSGGRTSAFMLYCILDTNNMTLPDNTFVVFCNTGKEHEATLEFVKQCQDQWNIPIVWLEYAKNDQKFKEVTFETASRNGEPFEQMIQYKQFLPNSVMRFCTTELKIHPITRFMKSKGYEDFQTLVGIRADEPRRVSKLRQTVHAPLALAGVTQTHVQQFWSQNDFDLGLQFVDKITPLGNCDLCFMKGAHQLMSIIQHEPDRATWWAKQEEIIGGRFSKDRPTYSAMIQFSKEQIDMFDQNEETIACFCGD